MKKIIIPILILSLLILTGGFVYKNIINPADKNILSYRSEITVTPTPLRLPNGIITEKEYAGEKYLILSVKIPEYAGKELIANFSEKISGEKLAEANTCDLGINGGFYLESGKPLGLFYISGKFLSKQTRSSIANAFVFSDDTGKLNFGRQYPADLRTVKFIFQTGPLVTVGPYKLKLVRDDFARRSLLARDRVNNIYLIMVTDKKSLARGPQLADLPIIFQELKDDNFLTFEEIINLDGGSASFFYSRDREGDLTLSSWLPIGSLLCIKL